MIALNGHHIRFQLSRYQLCLGVLSQSRNTIFIGFLNPISVLLFFIEKLLLRFTNREIGPCLELMIFQGFNYFVLFL